jgi:hypothetical protein
MTKNKIGAPRKYNKYDLSGEFGIGYTNKGEEFYFDLEDYDKIKNYCWNFHKSRGGKIYYVEARGNEGKIIKMQRVIMGVTSKEDLVDHISRINSDNRKQNLRITTTAKNSLNRGGWYKNKIGVSGISWRNDTNKWRVRIGLDYIEINIGQYDNLEDAIEARKNAEKKYYGDYGRKY